MVRWSQQLSPSRRRSRNQQSLKKSLRAKWRSLESLEPRLALAYSAPDGISYATDGTGIPQMSSYTTIPGGQPNPVVLYMDWNGDPSNGSEPAPATMFDTDGNPNQFAGTEQDHIWQLWKYLSETMSPFNINVTTVMPNTSTQKVKWMVFAGNHGGYGEMAPFGGPSDTHATGFMDAFMDPVSTAHEAGHGLGNAHTANYDEFGSYTQVYGGPTTDLNSSIMGAKANAFSRFLIWHSDAGASSYEDTAGNIKSWIASQVGGTGLRTDDYSSNLSTSAPTLNSGAQQTGVIETTTDADTFKFTATAGGSYQINVGRKMMSPVDLDVLVYNSSGVLVASNEQDARYSPHTTVNDAQIMLPSMGAGTYYVQVRSRGNAGDIGSYVVTMSSFSTNVWRSAEVGLTGAAGMARQYLSSNSFLLTGSGNDIYDSNDGFEYLYQTLQGDGTIIAQTGTFYRSPGTTNPSLFSDAYEAIDDWAKAGLMLRTSLDYDSPNISVVNSYRNGVGWQARTVYGGSTSTDNPQNGLGSYAPQYLKIVRGGGNITCYYSSNGTSWTQVGPAMSSATFPSKLYVGMVVTSHHNERSITVPFSNVSVTTQNGGVLNPSPVTIDPAMPVPTGVTATNSLTNQGQMIVTWTRVASASTFDSYTIMHSDNGIDWTVAGTVSQPGSGTTVSYTQSGLSGFTHHYYAVRTRLSSNGKVSNTQIGGVASGVTLANTPNGLRSIVLSNGTIVLEWNDVTGETGYKIQYSANGSSWSDLGTTSANVPFYNDTTANKPNARRYYRVQAMNGSGGSNPSSSISCGLNLSAAPTNLNWTGISSSNISLSWSPVVLSGATTSYRVQRSETRDDGSWSDIASGITSTSYNDTTVQPAHEYYYRVIAKSSLTGGESRSGIIFRGSWGNVISGWLDADLGVVGGTGSYHATNQLSGDITIMGSGADMWGNRDDGHFVYRTMTGNGYVLAHVADYENGDGADDWARVGIDFRESNAQDARHVGIFTTDNNGIVMQVRFSNGGTTEQQTVSFPGGFGHNLWLELDFNEGSPNDSFSGWYSFDSTNGQDGNWSSFPLSYLMAFNHSFNAGLFVNSHDNNKLETARFDQVGFSSSASASALTPLGSLGKTATSVSLATLAGASQLTAPVMGPLPYGTAPSASTTRHPAGPSLVANALTLNSTQTSGTVTNDLLLTLAKSQAKKRAAGVEAAFATLELDRTDLS